MTQAKGSFTPGPWTVEAPYLSEVQTPEGLTIASCWHEAADGATITVTGVLPCSPEQSAANARLIAAAPTVTAEGAFLLDRLADFESSISTDEDAREFHGHVAPAIARFRSAIQSATGEG